MRFLLLLGVLFLTGCDLILQDDYEIIYAQQQDNGSYIVSLKRLSDGTVFNQIVLSFDNPVVIATNSDKVLILSLISIYDLNIFQRRLTWKGFQSLINIPSDQIYYEGNTYD